MSKLADAPSPHVLTINGGSSSIKFALFAGHAPPVRVLWGKIDRIALSDATLSVSLPDQPTRTTTITAPDHRTAVDNAIAWMRTHAQLDGVHAIGHRVVHGGPRYAKPTQITPEVLDELRRISPLAPEHLPSSISLIEVFIERFPGVPQIALFDTAFHRDMPRVAKLLPIPRRFETEGVERYGFHGLSYTYLMHQLARLDGDAAARGRVILAHFGNGSSLCAVKDGRSVDTSMGFTPAAGIPMGRRSGDIDPGLVWYLNRTAGIGPDEFHRITNRESGLLGVSGGASPDMRDLLEREANGDALSADAVTLFCYQAKKWIGAYATVLNGLDTLVFAGGIGENAPAVRERICAGLEFLSIELDAARNARSELLISTDTGRVRVRVIPTDEEIVIARAVAMRVNIERQT